MRECARRPETWINDQITRAMCDCISSATLIHRSVAGREIGRGLYGVAIGGAFFGESMFHHVRDASKVALLGLVEHLRSRKFVLLDTQWLTPHLQQFGAIEVPARNTFISSRQR